MIILSIRLFFSAARGMNPEGLPQLSGACLYSNPPLLLSLRVFLTPPSFGHLPYILLCKTQGRRIATQSFSLYCFVAPRNAAGHGRGRDCDLILLLLLSLFFNPSVTTCHLPYILLRKTQRRRVRCISLSLLFRFYT
jgi:hypothetical protein